MFYDYNVVYAHVTSVVDGDYYLTLRALNDVSYGGPLSTSICHSTPLIIDNSPPFVYEIYNLTYDENTYTIGGVHNSRYTRIIFIYVINFMSVMIHAHVYIYSIFNNN